MKDLSVFAINLKRARESAGLKQKELAAKINITPQTISAYEMAEAGSKGKNPTLENALALAEALNVSLDELCGRDCSSKRTTFKSNRDIAEMIVFLNEVPHTEFSSVAETKEVFVGAPDGFPEFEEITEEFPTITIKDRKLSSFIMSWYKIRKLYNDGTIDRELYELWLSKHLGDIPETPADEFPF